MNSNKLSILKFNDYPKTKEDEARWNFRQAFDSRERLNMFMKNLEQNAHSTVMASHTVNDPSSSKVSERFFWFSIYSDATEKYQEKGDFKK